MSSVRSIIASQLTHLFRDREAAPDDDAEQLAAPKRRRRRASAVGDEAALAEAVATEIELEKEQEWEDTNYDHEEELQRNQAIDRVDDESESASEVAVDANGLPPTSIPAVDRTEANRAEDARIYQNTVARMPALDGRIVLRSKRKRASSVNYGINAVLERIDARLYATDDWLFDRDAALTVVDENARAQQTILALTVDNSPTVPPPRGMRKRNLPPVTLRQVRFERWMHYTTPKVYPTNVVLTMHLGSPMRLHYLLTRLPGVCFNPRCFAAVKMRKRGTHLIFSGGSVVCAGANSVELSRISCVECATLLMRVGVQAQVKDVVPRNVVTTADAGFDIDRFALALAFPTNAHFNPECFPGLMFRLPTPPSSSSEEASTLVIIVFRRKCIITGLPTLWQTLLAWRWFHSFVLWHFELKSTGGAHETEAEYRRRRRQETSMIQSMCQSIRDITTVHIANVVDQAGGNVDDADPTRMGDIYDPLMQMTQRVGHAYEKDNARPLPFDAWLDNVPLKELEGDVSSSVPPPVPPTTPNDVNENDNDDDDEDDEESSTQSSTADGAQPGYRAAMMNLAQAGKNLAVEFDGSWVDTVQQLGWRATFTETEEAATVHYKRGDPRVVFDARRVLDLLDHAFVLHHQRGTATINWVRLFRSEEKAVAWVDDDLRKETGDMNIDMECSMATVEQLLTQYMQSKK